MWLQAGDLAFGLAVAPRGGESGPDGGKVLAKPLGEGPEIARHRLRQPGCQIVGAVLPDHAPKSLGEVVQGRDLGRDVEQTLQVKPLFGCLVRRIAGQQQGNPAAGRSGERRCRALRPRCQTLAGHPLGHDPLPATEPGLAGFPPQLGAVTAALRPPPLQQRHIGHQRTPPGPPCLGLTAAHQLAHGVPGQTKLPDNRLDRHALAMETDRFVPGGPAALPALVLPALSARHRRWSVTRLLFAGDWAVYSLGRFAER